MPSRLRRVAGLQGCVQDLETVPAVWLWKRAPKCSFATPCGGRRCLPRTCAPRSWRPCRVGTGRRRGALGPGSSCRCADVPRVHAPPAVCVARTTLQPGELSSLTARRLWGPGSALLWRPPPPSSGKRTAICSAKAASVIPSLPARRPSTCAMARLRCSRPLPCPGLRLNGTPACSPAPGSCGSGCSGRCAGKAARLLWHGDGPPRSSSAGGWRSSSSCGSKPCGRTGWSTTASSSSAPRAARPRRPERAAAGQLGVEEGA